MAKKKNEDKNKSETKASFNTNEYIEAMDIPVWVKAGFLYYIEINNLTFKSEKELEKEYTKFKGE